MSQAGFTAPFRVHLLDRPEGQDLQHLGGAPVGFFVFPTCPYRLFLFLTLVTDTSFVSSRIYSTARVHLLNRPDGQDLQHLRDAPVGPNKNLFSS